MSLKQLDKHKILWHLYLLCCILIETIFAGFIMVWVFKTGIRLCYYPFYKDAKQVFELPEYNSLFVPQGLTYCEQEDVYLISGYIYKSNESRIYIVKPDGSYRWVPVMRDKETPLRSHSGGICQRGNFVYLAGGNGKCYVFDKESLLEETAGCIYVAGEFKTGNVSSFCYADREYLYVGEYYYRFKYVTRYDHHLETPGGDQNYAVITVFAFDKDSPNGVDEVPKAGLSVPGRIQGMCITDDDRLVLSASSIFQGSQLYYYDYGKILDGETGILNIRGKDIPLYYADSLSLLKTREILPKSEEIFYYDGQIYMLFESACSRFRYGTLLDGQFVYKMSDE